MLNPIIITGVPRSRTSLTTRILQICGVQLGKTCSATPWNPKGQFENREIIEQVEKLYLKQCGFDPMGQYPLPDPFNLPLDTTRKEKTLEILENQDIDLNKPYGFKDCKSILSFSSWINAFPDATWIIVHRSQKDIANSCEKAPFMKKRSDWKQYVIEYRSIFDKLKEICYSNTYEINTDNIIQGQLDELKYVIKSVGLEWNALEVQDFVDPAITKNP